ncbi:PAS/PAC sensor signal transduction histidine kinase [Candidatus Magnetoovum chiemensis]|nr:PAS/PAC sensor signal transduction histidine kinase [Candidatus Magnetoovum chiemensis]
MAYYTWQTRSSQIKKGPEEMFKKVDNNSGNGDGVDWGDRNDRGDSGNKGDRGEGNNSADDLSQAYEALKDRYDKLVKSVTGYVYTVETDDNGSACNIHGPGCETITGYTSQDYENDTFLWLRMVHNDDRDIVLNHVEDIKKGSYLPPIEHRIIHKDGSVRWIRNTLVSEYVNNDKVVKHGIITDITDRKLAENRLRENYNLISSVVDGINAIIYAEDSCGRYILANSTLCNFLGKDRDEILGKTVKDVFSPEMAAIMEEMDSKVFLEGKPLTSVNEIHHSGSSYVFLTNKTLYKDANGKDIGIIGISQDITLLKQKEEKERLLLKELKMLLNNLPLGVAYLDKDFNILELNDFSCSALKLTKDDFIGKKCYNLYGEYAHDSSKQGKDKICSYCKVNECIREGRSISYSSKYKDIYVRKTVIPEYNENGEIIRVLEIVEDITAYITKELLETIAHGITDEIMLIDNDYKILWVNNATLINHVYKMDEIVGMHCYEVTHHSDSQCFAPSDPCPLRDYKENAAPVIHQHIAKDGTERYVEVSLYPIRDGNGDKFVHITKDITERVTSDKKIRELNRTLEKRVREQIQINREKEQMLIQKSKMASMGEMINMIAHQWRQPLNVLNIVLLDIEDTYNFGELTKEYIDNQVAVSTQQIRFMSRTIDDFRNFFKPSDIKVSFDVKTAIEELISMFIQMFKTNSIEIHINSQNDTKISFADGYPNEFKQVALNILNNSKDAILDRRSFSGSIVQGRIDINITNDEERNQIIILIKDNGGGIPSEVIERIFEPYFTTKKSEGTGIGLFISKTIIETRMNGVLNVHNTDGGAEFVIRLNSAESVECRT